MNFVGFIHRHTKPATPVPGAFYWVDVVNDEPQMWFAPTDNQDDMILLNNKEIGGERFAELVSRVEAAEGSIEEIQERISNLKDEILGELDLSSYLEDYVTKEELEDYHPDVELTDSDYDRIAEKVNEKTFKLTWKAI
jgi:hypothetical protein